MKEKKLKISKKIFFSHLLKKFGSESAWKGESESASKRSGSATLVWRPDPVKNGQFQLFALFSYFYSCFFTLILLLDFLFVFYLHLLRFHGLHSALYTKKGYYFLSVKILVKKLGARTGQLFVIRSLFKFAMLDKWKTWEMLFHGEKVYCSI